MYEFAILALVGLLTVKSVELIGHLTHKTMSGALELLATAAVGVIYAFAFDFSIFAAWGVDVRSETVGLIATGAFMTGLAALWREVTSMVSDWAHKSDSSSARISRAA